MSDEQSTGITLFVMTRKGLHTLKALWATHPALLQQVVGAPNKGVENDYFEEIEQFCASNGLPFCTREVFDQVETTHAMAVSWRWMIDPGESLLVVFHDSLLPRYRGFNPLVSALINGDEEVGVTALIATEDVDAGPIVGQESVAVRYPITISEAIGEVLELYAALAVGIAHALAAGHTLQATPQDDAEATYSLWRDDEDYRIQWEQSAATIARTIDAVGPPYKGAATLCDGVLARIRAAEPCGDLAIENRVPGKVLRVDEEGPVVVCGSGLLRIMQLEDDTTGASLLPLGKFRTRFG